MMRRQARLRAIYYTRNEKGCKRVQVAVDRHVVANHVIPYLPRRNLAECLHFDTSSVRLLREVLRSDMLMWCFAVIHKLQRLVTLV